MSGDSKAPKLDELVDEDHGDSELLPLAADQPAAPLLTSRGESAEAETGGKRLRKWVSLEFLLALGIVLLATIVANTVPAKHAIIQNWP